MFAKANEKKKNSHFRQTKWYVGSGVDDETNEAHREKNVLDFCTCRARFKWPQTIIRGNNAKEIMTIWFFSLSIHYSLSTIWSGEAINKSGNFQLVILEVVQPK